MLFQHINRHADKHRKRVYLVLVVVISLSFVVWVTPRGCDGDSRPGAHTKVGKMYGKTITQGDFIKATQETDLGSFLRTGRWIGNNRSNNEELTADTMRRLMALREARRQGLDSVSMEEFTSYVKGRPMLQTDEAFDAEKLKTFRENVTRGLRLTGAEFDQVIRDNIAIDRLEAQATNGLVVSPVEIHDAFVQAYELFTIGYGEVKIDAATNGDPAQSELDAYFAAHQQDLRLPDGKILRMASFLIPTDLSKVPVTEERIAEVYEKQKDTSYKGKTLAEVHDLIRNNLARTDANGKAAAAARTLREDLAKAPEGEPHEALLQRFSELATKYGAVVADTEPVRPTDKEVPGFADVTMLARQTVRLSEGAALGSLPTIRRRAGHDARARRARSRGERELRARRLHRGHGQRHQQWDHRQGAAWLRLCLRCRTQHASAGRLDHQARQDHAGRGRLHRAREQGLLEQRVHREQGLRAAGDGARRDLQEQGRPHRRAHGDALRGAPPGDASLRSQHPARHSEWKDRRRVSEERQHLLDRWRDQ